LDFKGDALCGETIFFDNASLLRLPVHEPAAGVVRLAATIVSSVVGAV